MGHEFCSREIGTTPFILSAAAAAAFKNANEARKRVCVCVHRYANWRIQAFGYTRRLSVVDTTNIINVECFPSFAVS